MAKVPLYGGTDNHAWVVARPGIGMPGNVWFVDSGAGGGADDAAHGKTMAAPFVTLDYAIGRCTASQGDVIYLLPGHAETIAAGAASPNMDVAGVSVIGLGEGAARPTFTFTHNDANIILAADNCSIENLLLVVGVDGVDELVDVNAAGCRIENCEFRYGAGMQANYYIMIDCAAHAADYTVIRGCKMVNIAAGMTTGIRVITNAQDHLVIENNYMGNWNCNLSVVPACKNMLIRNNLLVNLSGDVPIAIASGASTGLCIGNRFVDISNLGVAYAGGMYCLANMGVSLIDTAGVVAPYYVSRALLPDGYVASDSFTSSVGEKTADGIVVTRATAALPQTAADALFTVTKRVLLKRLVGVVTTAIGNVPNVTHLQLNSTGAGATTDLCLAVGGLDIDNDAADTNYTITGAFGDAMVATLDIPAATTKYEIVLPPGDLEVECAGNDGGGGRVRWTATYVPLEDGAQMVAA